MGPEKKLHLLFLLPVVFHLSTGQSIHSDRRLQDTACPVLCNGNGQYSRGLCQCYTGWEGTECDVPFNQCVDDIHCGREGLHCLNDYNNNITCVWSISVSDQRTVAADTKCTLNVIIIMDDDPYETSCDLRPFDDSKPAMRRCSLVYSDINYVFDSELTCSININCEPLNNNLISITYKPADHIKLSPPGSPSIINSTISWEVPENNLVQDYSFQIQWKQEAQSWEDALERNRSHCGLHCNMELDPEVDLERNEKYQVRVRVLASDYWAKSTWSDWSPTTTWRSLIGRPAGLHCLNDYDNNITCVWNSTSVSDQRTVALDTKCTLVSSMVLYGKTYNSTPCDLRPFDESKPAMRKCSLVYSTNYVFKSDRTCTIILTCEPLNNNLMSIIYKPADHIKLNPPQKPLILDSTISWKVPENTRVKEYSFHIQWKREAQSWMDALERNRPHCGSHYCQMELKHLEQDEKCQVRVRVLASDYWAKSTWSDWSPTAWRSGRQPDNATGGRRELPWGTVIGVILGVVVVLSLAIILCKTQIINWVYVVKKFEGPPLPNPAKFFLHDGNLKAWPNPQFTNESFESLLKKVDIFSPIEVSSNVDKCALCGPEKKQSGSGCTSHHSGFSNPNYFHPCPPPISSLTEGNLEPCAVDSPYGPSGSQNDREEERGKHTDILKWLSNGSISGESMEECSEQVEKLQDQGCGLHSPDSGISSGGEEEVSQDSLDEEMQVIISDGQSKELQGKGMEQKKSNETNVLAGGEVTARGVYSGGSIEVCSDYERVEKLQDQLGSLQSPDSGMGSGVEEQTSQATREV